MLGMCRERKKLYLSTNLHLEATALHFWSRKPSFNYNFEASKRCKVQWRGTALRADKGRLVWIREALR
ncbi:MAG: hypothetical protein DRH12_04515 [Deltaproteobacteria bacterium]|nr:MAG: hypothetical protein DRH12_04515 [Deltaproteobacteria bacterium]